MKLPGYIALLVLLSFTSCVKEVLIDKPEKPEPVNPVPGDTSTYILVNVDWGGVSGSGMDDVFSVMASGNNVSLSVGNQPDTIAVSPGNYDIYICNTLPGVSINNGVASMNVGGAGNIIPLKQDVFFAATANVTAIKGETVIANIKPERCTRQLEIIFELPASDTIIMAVSGTLNNVARTFDIKAGQEGTPGTVLFNLLDTNIVNLFGFVSVQQILTVEVENIYGYSQETTVDLSSDLLDFNNNKNQPKTIIIRYEDLEF